MEQSTLCRGGSRVRATLFLTLAFCVSLSGQSVDSLEIGKKLDYLQTSGATPTNQQNPGDVGGPFHFMAAASGTSLNLFNPALKITSPLSTQYTLTGDAIDRGYVQNFATKAELDAAFPIGNYTLSGGANSALAAVTVSEVYSTEIPQLTNGTWNGSGRLLVAANNGATLTFNSFSQYTTSPGAMALFTIHDYDGSTVTSEIISQANIRLDGVIADPALNYYSIPSNLLQPGRLYYGELTYGRITAFTTSSSLTAGLAVTFRSTGFIISTPLTTTAPSITTQPTSRTVRAGESTTFSVVATGDPAPSYQWLRNSVEIPGATQSSLTLNNVSIPNGGEYKVRVSSIAGAVISAGALLFVDPAATLPVFTQHPSPQDIGINESVTFSASATGEPVPTYQWKKNGSNISFATGASYTINFAQLGDAGTYTVVATNTAGSTTSTPAILTVLTSVAPPAFTGPVPTALTVSEGTPTNVTLPVTGSPAPTILWSKNSQVLVGETSASLTVQGNADPTRSADFYTARISNRYGVISTSFYVYAYPANFDHAGYYARNQDLVAAYGSDPFMAWAHFYNYGLAEGRSYDTNFKVDEYLELNPDLKASFGTDQQAALFHWLRYGNPIEDRMGRVPVGFNVDSYLARYPDLATAFGSITPRAVRNVTVWQHYLDWGVREGRSDGDFEAYNYLATNSDLAAVFGTDIEAAALHWYFYGRREGRRIPAGFDVQSYRSRNPDIAVVWGNDLYGSWLHYRDTGIYEGRTYDDLFRVLEYRARYTDVQTAYGNDLTGILFHWLYYGRLEGRLGRNP